MKHFCPRLSRRAFWVLCALLVCLRLTLTGFQQAYIWVGGAPLDDELMFRAANNITAGQWLGAYDYLTLSKAMFFPVWLALLHALHLPYLISGAALWCGAALLAAFAFSTLWRKKDPAQGRVLTLGLFAALAFLPSSWAAYTLRVYRDNIFPALCLYFFAGMAGMALRAVFTPEKPLWPWLAAAGGRLSGDSPVLLWDLTDRDAPDRAGQPLHQLGPALGVDADGHVVQAAEHLGVGADVQAGEVEEGDEVAVADVEEEVRGAGVVAVLDQLGQREAQHVLVEADGALDVAADQRGVVQPAGGRGRALAGRLQVRGADAGKARIRPARPERADVVRRPVAGAQQEGAGGVRAQRQQQRVQQRGLARSRLADQGQRGSLERD